MIVTHVTTRAEKVDDYSCRMLYAHTAPFHETMFSCLSTRLQKLYELTSNKQKQVCLKDQMNKRI
jgi:hypothetical protein